MIRPTIFPLAFATLVLAGSAAAQQSAEESFFDLSGEWQFATGDDPAWKTPGPGQDQWSTILVPGAWESQGFPEYDGYAWFRRAFKMPPSLQAAEVLLHIGRIDDADEVFVNGTFVGSTGGMPPTYSTAYNVTRVYTIPRAVLRLDDENIIAVRVFDQGLDGGIVEGRVGLAGRTPTNGELIRLDGVWSFQTGDDPAWSSPETDKEGWSNVTVPGNWEPQGYRDYDGYAWYRKEFFLPAQTEPGPYVLALGRIDDLDQTFVNGVEVGHTGSIDRSRVSDNDWRSVREYTIPVEALRFGDYNVIAVRVYDGTGGGGLYEGPHALYPANMDENALQTRLQELLHRVTGQ